jgi:hypothetical protein
VVTGTTKPAKRGTRVTLWRKTSVRTVKIAAGRVRADGTYRLAKAAASRGTWTVLVKVAKASGNLSGTSRTRSIVVS